MSENPYAAPRADELAAPSDLSAEQAQALRGRYRSAERLVRSIGLVYFVQALGVVLVSFMLLTSGLGDRPAVLSAALYCFVLSLVLMTAGFSLRLLAPWSRLVALLQTFYLLAGFMFGLFALDVDARLDGRIGFIFAVLHSLPFYVLFAPRAGIVLTPRYADVIAATPGQSPSSWPLAVLVVVILASLILADYLLFASAWLR